MAEKYVSKPNFQYFWGRLKTLFNGKVDKETGKGLSTNDFTDALKNDLATIKADYITASKLSREIAAAGHIKFEYVTALPATGLTNTIYFLKDASTETGNTCEAYLYEDNNWEKIVSKEADFSGVWTKDELQACSNEELDTILNA